MVIEEINIENYKGISSLKFSPRKINLIVGRNNTGKTSILEAIDIFFHNEKIVVKNMNSLINVESINNSIEISVKSDGKKKDMQIREAKEEEIVDTFKKELLKGFIQNLTESKKEEDFGEMGSKELENVILDVECQHLCPLLLTGHLSAF